MSEIKAYLRLPQAKLKLESAKSGHLIHFLGILPDDFDKQQLYNDVCMAQFNNKNLVSSLKLIMLFPVNIFNCQIYSDINGNPIRLWSVQNDASRTIKSVETVKW